MGKYRFGLHTGEVSEYLFGLHDNHLTAVADQIAARHGAWHVNYKESCGERRGWFACPNLGPAFYQVIARAVMADVDRAGGIKALYRDELDSAADERCGGMPTFPAPLSKPQVPFERSDEYPHRLRSNPASVDHVSR